MVAALLPLLAAAIAPDWSAALRADARALHEQVATTHPGPVDSLNPGFSRANDEGLALALKRAERVRDFGGYWFALSAYVAAFDDGHLSLRASGERPVSYRWPGFLTGFDAGGAQTVATRADDAPVPLGAILVGCDGRSAARLAAESVGAFTGRWMLKAQRQRWGGTLLVDQGNPFATLPAKCTFRVGKQVRSVRLQWRPITLEELSPRLAETERRARPEIAARTLSDGTRWFQLSSFDGDPASTGGKALPPLIAAIASDRDAIASAPRIVLDLRGNGGGSSDWSRQIAVQIWGESAVAGAGSRDLAVDWRVSTPAIENLSAFREGQVKGGHASPEMVSWLDRVIAGLTDARAKGVALWRDADDSQDAPAPAKAVAPLSAKVYVLTDPGCASACLDAVDLWTALGAVHIGQETSADTLYMDTRRAPLPSGLASVAIPMKVYRGRSRGSNVALVPRFAFGGDMRDGAALERWVATLPRSGN